MRIELKEVKVELDVKRSHLVVNGETVPISREVGIKLVFGNLGEAVGSKPTKALDKKKAAKKGCQTAASRKKLSLALRKHYAKKRREARKGEKPGLKKAKKMNGHSQMGLFN